MVAWGPTPSSHMRHPVDPLLWRSARELIKGFSPVLPSRIFLGSKFLPSIFLFYIPFSHLTFIPLLFSVVHACCPSAVFVVLMQSTFSVRNMDSTSEPPSPNMAAATSAKRKFRKCSLCPSRMPSFDFDNHTLCTKCRNQVCDLEIVCDECRDWPLQKRKVLVSYNKSLKARREYKKRKASPTVAIPSFEIRSKIQTRQGDPILKEYQTANQSRLRYDRVWETTHPTRRVTPS